MFQPKKYLKNDPDYIFNFIQNHPFATFVIKGKELLATHIPVLTKGTPNDFNLYAHIAQANEQYRYLKDNLEALLIFQGPHAYVSSSWYREKDISTWDYSAVHINVKLKIQTEEELETSLQELVKHFEKGQKKPLLYEEYPEDMVKEHLPLITGFWCIPTKIQAIAKLHQGYEKDDIHNITNELEDQKGLAAELGKNIKKEHGTHN
jgi:transcriptional regulator